jgi:hypothetical protein
VVLIWFVFDWKIMVVCGLEQSEELVVILVNGFGIGLVK